MQIIALVLAQSGPVAKALGFQVEVMPDAFNSHPSLPVEMVASQSLPSVHALKTTRHSGPTAHDKGDSSNHCLKTPFSCA